MRCRHDRRRGATTVEFAMVAPVAFTLLLAPIVGGLGVFHYQQVSYLAQEAARWASVHGTQYAQDTGNKAATATDIYQQVIAPRATGLDLTKLTHSVIWNKSNQPHHTVIVGGKSKNIANTVTVTVTYQWLPKILSSGGTLKSTSTTTMSY